MPQNVNRRGLNLRLASVQDDLSSVLAPANRTKTVRLATKTDDKSMAYARVAVGAALDADTFLAPDLTLLT